MEVGLVGLGRMGANMARRWQAGGVRVTGFDADETAIARAGVAPVAGLAQLVAELRPPRTVWLMLPAGEVTALAVNELAGLLAPGDIVVDGANSWYRDSQRHAAQLSACGIGFSDVGVSGGVWGRDEGYGLMAGGDAQVVARIEPLLRLLAPAPDRGWLRCGPAGSGHFVKMVHNGIEYGLMAAYAEGFALLQAKEEFSLDLPAIAESWRHGSVVRSWLLDLTTEFLRCDPALESAAPWVSDSGAGRWTALEAIEQGVPAPVISLALMMRFASRGEGDYAARMQAMMRQAFGGHALREVDDSQGSDA